MAAAKGGATLLICLVCRAVFVELTWIGGRGWCCPVCKTDVEGRKHERDTDAKAGHA